MQSAEQGSHEASTNPYVAIRSSIVSIHTELLLARRIPLLPLQLPLQPGGIPCRLLLQRSTGLVTRFLLAASHPRNWPYYRQFFEQQKVESSQTVKKSNASVDER